MCLSDLTKDLKNAVSEAADLDLFPNYSDIDLSEFDENPFDISDDDLSDEDDDQLEGQLFI